MTGVGNGIAGRFRTRGFLWGALLQLASIGVVWFEVQSRLIPAVARDVSFATFYTAERIFLDAPNELANLYRNDWFNDQLQRHGFPHLRDIYFGNPPTTGALLTPLALMPVAMGRVVWAVVNLAALVGGMAALLRALRISLRWTAPLVALAVRWPCAGRALAVLTAPTLGKDEVPGVCLDIARFIHATGRERTAGVDKAAFGRVSRGGRPNGARRGQ